MSEPRNFCDCTNYRYNRWIFLHIVAVPTFVVGGLLAIAVQENFQLDIAFKK